MLSRLVTLIALALGLVLVAAMLTLPDAPGRWPCRRWPLRRRAACRIR
jgi:hypothetical protein